MHNPSTPRTHALLQALLVTFLWSTSWVLIKRTLTEIPPLLFAGLRYTLAAIVLLPGLIRRRAEVRELERGDWLRLIVLGLVLYTLTQGGQFVTLQHLEAVTFSLVLNFTSIPVALAGILTLHELPGRLQWLGIALFGAGALSYFWGGAALTGRGLGLVLACLTMGANAGASLLGRWVNRGQRLTPLVVTGISMGAGAIVMLVLGLVIEGWPSISLRSWAVILWLAVVNSALAFTLWNRSLVVLSAVESSVINNTMLIQIAILAWAFLGERPAPLQIGGLVLATVGVVLVSGRQGCRSTEAVDLCPSSD